MPKLLPLALVLLAACGDNPAWTPDAPDPLPIDAAALDAALVPDAGIDAAPPGPDDPCQYLPGDDQTMSNYPLRFGPGQGLEDSPDLRQTGLLQLQNAELGNRQVIELRRGAAELGDSRSTTPGDDVPLDERIAIWARGNEVLLETGDSIYRLRRAATDFVWGLAAPWTRSRLREAYANTFSSDVLSADYAVIGDATLVAYQLSGGTVELAIYGPTLAREVLQTFATSERPRLTFEGDRVRLTYRDTSTNTLFSGTYSAGASSITVANTTIAANAGRAWDVSSVQLDTGNRVTIYAVADAGPNVIVNVVAASRTATHTVATTFATVTDVNVTIWPLEFTGGNIRYAITYIGFTGAINRSVVTVFDLPVSAGAVVQTSAIATNLAATTHAVSASWESADKLWVANEETSGTLRRVVYGRADASVAIGFTTAGATHESTSLVGQGAIMAGTPTNTLNPDDPLVPGFVEQLIAVDLLLRSGWIVYAPRTGEIVARSFVGFTGDLTTRSARPPKGSFIRIGDNLTWAGPAAVPSDPSTNLRAIAICRLDRTARANKPAVLDGTAISAHAGYARAYDGVTAFEHDWHSLVKITAIGGGAAGTTTAGVHRVAVWLEADDANGLRYESAPQIDPGSFTSLGGAGSGVDVTITAFTHTERVGVRAVIGMTLAGGAVYHKAATAAVTGASQVINVSILDATLATRETLRQAPVPAGQNIVPSVPGRVTDFVALLIDRVASRDPRDGSLLTFTTPSAEASGFSAHWYDEGVLQEPLERDLTSAVEMDGRIVLAAPLGLAQLQGDGPDATGAGSFGIPLVLRASAGFDDHAATERTSVGYAFTFDGEPFLLSPNLSVEHIAEQVERHYTIDGGHCVAMSWDALRDEITFLDDVLDTLRVNPHNGRWCTDTERTGRDITVTEDGTVYLIRYDGKVLRQDDSYADGDEPYALLLEGPWAREPARDQLAHGGFNFAGVEVYGEYLGSHDLTVTVYLDFRDSPVIFQGTIPAATIDANAAAGRDYRYVLYTESRHCYACKVVLQTSAEPNQTARIAGVDIRYNDDKSPNPAEVSSEQRFPLAISAYS